MTNEEIAGWFLEFVRTLIIYRKTIKPPVRNYANHIKILVCEKEIKRSNNKNEKMLNLTYNIKITLKLHQNIIF